MQYKRKIYIRPEEVREETEAEKEWLGGEIPRLRYTDPKKSGEIIIGKKVTPADLPKYLYHVTTHLKEVLDSKILLASATMEKGGLGGGAVGPQVSFTKELEIARLIKRELIRVVKISKGQMLNSDFTEWTREDERLANLEPGTLEPARRELLRMIELEKEKYNKISPDYQRYAYNVYLKIREDLGGPIDPIIYGRTEAFAKIDINDIGIIRIDSSSLPRDVLIRENPMGFEFLQEVAVHGDVPLIDNLYTVLDDDDEEHIEA